MIIDDAILEKEDAITIDDVEVEDILQFALEEKRGKQEAVQVLSQLQANYDDVQRKLAEAENKIDKYRYDVVFATYFYSHKKWLRM